MKKVMILLVVMLAGTISVHAQKEDRTSKKARKQAEHEANMIFMSKLLENKTYVIEVNTLINSQGVTVPVTSNINFLMVNGKEATLQLSSASGPGFNGVGGVTLEGKVSEYSIKERKNNFIVRIDIFGAGITSNAFLDVMADGFSQLTIRTLQGQKIEARGILKPLSESKVFKGRSSN